MSIKIITTTDGSHTLFSDVLDEPYHSVKGAIQESVHIFINANLQQIEKNTIHIFEMGFGTGLNALLAYQKAEKNDKTIYYTTIEKFPINTNIIEKLNYSNILKFKSNETFNAIHDAKWNETAEISKNFILNKINGDILDYKHTKLYDSVFFDAFDPAKQPMLWSEKIFYNLYKNMRSGGILTTYSAKGVVRRAMKSAGFSIEKLPGPPGKREMTRAVKTVLC